MGRFPTRVRVSTFVHLEASCSIAESSANDSASCFMGPFYAEEANHQAVVPGECVRIDALRFAAVPTDREEVGGDPLRALVRTSAVAHRVCVGGEACEANHAASVMASWV